jgi:transketolase
MNTIRLLAPSAVQKEVSGDPGVPMGATAMIYTNWTHQLWFNPHNPKWLGRSHVFLSCEQGYPRLFSMFTTASYGLQLKYINNFHLHGNQA